jgi:phage repressor protein C with HTH and peptisase S24 domain
MSKRVQNNSKFSDEEIKKIESFYGIKIDKQAAINEVALDFYPDVFGSCGSGSMVFSEASEKISVTKELITNYSASNKYSVISARGSSMSPVINDDDKLVIQHDLGGQIVDDTVYLFRYNDELFIKRLVKNVDQIVCISENPRFQDRIIEPKEDNFSIIGKVVGLFRSKV